MQDRVLKKLQSNPHYKFKEVHTQEVRSDDVLVTAPKVRRKRKNSKPEEPIIQETTDSSIG